jgi:Single-strand binding protein family
MKEEVALSPEGVPQVKALALPAMPCPTCDQVVTPVLGPGAGQHVARALCPQGHHIKWLPRALFAGRKDPMPSINRVILCGVISKYGVTVKYATSGAACASFTLVLSESGQDGKAHTTFVDCECWGKKAEAAGELDAGQLALFEGKLAKRKKGESWETIVSGFDVMPLAAPVASLTGSPN